jgi:cellulose synthase/poly-beta-1,6-N-acetylglucosamine synthase-like glycosyltransferase
MLDTMVRTGVTVCTVMAAVASACYAWDLLVSLAGFLRLRTAPPSDLTPRFAVLICAHNEERVVAGVIRSVLAQSYPRDRVTVFVVADHCSDQTAEVARREGATVIERQNADGRTKGYALQFGIQAIRKTGAFDALCVFDADNVVSPDFFETMARYLAAGHVAIQAYLDTKNPDASWVTRSIALSYWVTNRFWLRARTRLGLPATLGGTGFCLAWSVVDGYQFEPRSVADDLELTMNLVMAGVRVSYCAETRTYDEKPVTLAEALRQRTRWLQGHNDVAFRWVGPIARAALTRPSIKCLDAALHLLQPMRLLMAFGALLGLALAALVAPDHHAIAYGFRFTAPAWALWAMVFLVYPFIVAASEGAAWRALRSGLPMVLFSLTWIPAATIGLIRRNRRVWTHTVHGGP